MVGVTRVLSANDVVQLNVAYRHGRIPALLLALTWRRFNTTGAVCGVVLGFCFGGLIGPRLLNHGGQGLALVHLQVGDHDIGLDQAAETIDPRKHDHDEDDEHGHGHHHGGQIVAVTFTEDAGITRVNVRAATTPTFESSNTMHCDGSTRSFRAVTS